MTQPIFQHRHYVKLANIIADMPDTPIDKGIIANLFADGLRGTNPNYDRARFVTAAIGEPCNGRDKVR